MKLRSIHHGIREVETIGPDGPELSAEDVRAWGAFDVLTAETTRVASKASPQALENGLAWARANLPQHREVLATVNEMRMDLHHAVEHWRPERMWVYLMHPAPPDSAHSSVVAMQFWFK